LLCHERSPRSQPNVTVAVAVITNPARLCLCAHCVLIRPLWPYLQSREHVNLESISFVKRCSIAPRIHHAKWSAVVSFGNAERMCWFLPLSQLWLPSLITCRRRLLYARGSANLCARARVGGADVQDAVRRSDGGEQPAAVCGHDVHDGRVHFQAAAQGRNTSGASTWCLLPLLSGCQAEFR
jgi:hypothetical protein